jgi:hypothetical protein
MKIEILERVPRADYVWQLLTADGKPLLRSGRLPSVESCLNEITAFKATAAPEVQAAPIALKRGRPNELHAPERATLGRQ